MMKCIPECCIRLVMESQGSSVNNAKLMLMLINETQNQCYLSNTIKCLPTDFLLSFLDDVTQTVSLFSFLALSFYITGIPHDDIDQSIFYQAEEDKDGAGIHEHIDGFDVGDWRKGFLTVCMLG